MLTSIDVKFFDSACLSANLGDKGLFRSANILQVADVVRRVVFLLFLLYFQPIVRPYRKNSENKPGAYIFQTPFLRGLFLEGPIFGGANMRFKIGQAYTGREICVSKSIELACSQKDIYVSNLHQVLTETRLEDIDLSKTQSCKYFVYISTEEI